MRSALLVFLVLANLGFSLTATSAQGLPAQRNSLHLPSQQLAFCNIIKRSRTAFGAYNAKKQTMSPIDAAQLKAPDYRIYDRALVKLLGKSGSFTNWVTKYLSSEVVYNKEVSIVSTIYCDSVLGYNDGSEAVTFESLHMDSGVGAFTAPIAAGFGFLPFSNAAVKGVAKLSPGFHSIINAYISGKLYYMTDPLPGYLSSKSGPVTVHISEGSPRFATKFADLKVISTTP